MLFYSCFKDCHLHPCNHPHPQAQVPWQIKFELKPFELFTFAPQIRKWRDMQQIFSYMVSMRIFCCCVSSNSLLSSFCMTTLLCCVAFLFFQNILFGCYNTTPFYIPSAVPSYRCSPFQTNLVNDAKNNYVVEIIFLLYPTLDIPQKQLCSTNQPQQKIILPKLLPSKLEVKKMTYCQ